MANVRQFTNPEGNAPQHGMPDPNTGRAPEVDPGQGAEPPAFQDPNTNPGAANSVINDYDISGWPYRFNPSLHASAMPRRIDYADTATTTAGAAEVRAYMDVYRSDRNAPKNVTDASIFAGYRLLRIVQGDTATGAIASTQHNVRYGFRALFNPSTWNTTAARNDTVVLDPQSTGNYIMSGLQNQNFTSYSFQLLLLRQPDVFAGAGLRATSYSPRIAPAEMAKLQQYGTMWDLEYLMRVCNGLWQTLDNGVSGNLGMLAPAGSYLILGPGRRDFGYLQSISYVHKMFSEHMVPVLTEVGVNFTRIPDFTANQANRFKTELGETIAANPDQQPGAPVGGGGGGGDFSDPTTNAAGMQPIHDGRIGTGYGVPGSRWHWKGYHTGVDYPVPTGTPVYATRGGQVTYAGHSHESSYGNHLVVKVGDVSCYYAHGSRFLVKQGEFVAAGQQIMLSGATGNVSGPHLHYEERVGGQPRSPKWNEAK